jgi:hypothetical protein
MKANYQVGTIKLKEQKTDTNKQDNKVDILSVIFTEVEIIKC